jgi:hypothetical protein
MHTLSAIVTGLLVTSGAATALLGEFDVGGIPLTFGGQDPDVGGNGTDNETAGNETSPDNTTANGNTTEEGNSTAGGGGNVTEQNATADGGNGTHDYGSCYEHNHTEYDEPDCYVGIHDSDDVFIDGSGEWTWEVTDDMRYLNVYVWASSFGAPGLGDSLDIVLRDPSGDTVAEFHNDGDWGSFGSDAFLQVDLDREEDEFMSGEWSLSIEMRALHGNYDVMIEAYCDEYWSWW